MLICTFQLIDDPSVNLACPHQDIYQVYGVPAFNLPDRVLSCPADIINIDGHRVLRPVLSFQDMPHMITKYRNRVQSRLLQIGNTVFSLVPLTEIFSDAQKALIFEAETKLRRSDLKPDKMNFQAAQRLFSPEVSSALLRLSPPTLERAALLQFLRIGHYLMTSFLDPSLHPNERMYRVFYARFALEAWHADLQQRANVLQPAELFVSANLFDCVKLNSEQLLIFTLWLCDYPRLRATTPYAPWVFWSQYAEKLFRSTRADTHGNNNFNFAEFLRSIARNDAAQLLLAANPAFSVGPSHKKHFRLDELCKKAFPLPDDVTGVTLLAAVRHALADVLADLASFKVSFPLDTPAQSPFADIHVSCHPDSDDDDDSDASLIDAVQGVRCPCLCSRSTYTLE